MGVPLNDINSVYDLGFPEYEWGEVGLLPFNLQSAQSVVDGMEMPSEDPALAEPSTEGNEQRRDADGGGVAVSEGDQ